MRVVHGIILGVPIGLAAGICGYTFVYAKGGSYMTNKPEACANCHIMQEHYDGWTRSSHRAVAVCNDCHTPSDVIGKYGTKMSNGWHHSYAFTTGDFHEPIQMTPRNRAITEHSCRKCHHDIVDAIESPHPEMVEGPHRDIEELSCVRCHSSVGHPR